MMTLDASSTGMRARLCVCLCECLWRALPNASCLDRSAGDRGRVGTTLRLCTNGWSVRTRQSLMWRHCACEMFVCCIVCGCVGERVVWFDGMCARLARASSSSTELFGQEPVSHILLPLGRSASLFVCLS